MVTNAAGAPERIRQLAELALRAATSEITYDVDSWFDALTHVSDDELPLIQAEALRMDPTARVELAALITQTLELASHEAAA